MAQITSLRGADIEAGRKYTMVRENHNGDIVVNVIYVEDQPVSQPDNRTFSFQTSCLFINLRQVTQDESEVIHLAVTDNGTEVKHLGVDEPPVRCWLFHYQSRSHRFLALDVVNKPASWSDTFAAKEQSMEFVYPDELVLFGSTATAIAQFIPMS